MGAREDLFAEHESLVRRAAGGGVADSLRLAMWKAESLAHGGSGRKETLKQLLKLRIEEALVLFSAYLDEEDV